MRNVVLCRWKNPLFHDQVRESLMNRAADFGITLEDVAITHLSFGTEVGI